MTDFLKKLICAGLCFALVLSLAACTGETVIKQVVIQKPNENSTDNNGDDITNETDDSDEYFSDREIIKGDSTTDVSNTAEAEDDSDLKYASWDGPSGYTLIYAAGNSDAKEYAELLKAHFKSAYGVELTIADDKSAATAKEIIVGKTTRYSASLKENEYSVSLSGKKLVFSAGSTVMLKSAVQRFIRKDTTKNKVALISKKTDFVSTALGKYTYVWGDEFEGSVLDKTLWSTETRMSITAEMTVTDADTHINVNNGTLNLLASRYWNPKVGGAEFVTPYSVTTGKTMSYKFGYVEMRAKVPFKRGAWPSLWTSNQNILGPQHTFDYDIEIDVFENFATTDTLVSNIHKWYKDGRHTQWSASTNEAKKTDEERSYTFTSDNINNEYHIYGFEWTPEKINMYIDGKIFSTYDMTQNFDDGASGMDGFNTQIALILNNHLFTKSSDWLPYADCDIYVGDLPLTYTVDYIRLYQKNDGISKLYTAK